MDSMIFEFTNLLRKSNLDYSFVKGENNSRKIVLQDKEHKSKSNINLIFDSKGLLSDITAQDKHGKIIFSSKQQ